MSKVIFRIIELIVLLFIVWLIASWLEIAVFSLYDHQYQSWNLFQILAEHYKGTI